MKSLIKIFVLVAGVTFMYSCDWFEKKPVQVEENPDSTKEVKIDTLQKDTLTKVDEKAAPDTGIVVKEEEKKK